MSRYNKITADDLTYLSEAVDPSRVFPGNAISEDYCHDEMEGVSSRPEVLIKVLSTEEVSKVLAYANRRAIPVVVRGSGTGLVGAAVAVAGGIMLDMTGMNHILELDADNLTVTVEPGVLLMDLAAFVEGNGFLYPPDPGEKSATIGGNISTNAGGMRAVKYGVTRDYVRGLTVVMPNGEIMELGGKMVKNSSGYSLLNLVIGSEGTLCVITKAILKLVPLPRYSVSLLVPFPSMDAALDVVPVIIRAGALPVAIEYFSRETILLAEEYLGRRFPDKNSPAYLLLTFDGTGEQEVEQHYRLIADTLLELGAEDVLIVDTDERKKSVWTPRGAFLEAIKASTTEMDECDVVVPRVHVADFIQYTHALAKEMDIRIPSFGHAGDGNLHVYICRDDLEEPVWKEKCAVALDRMYSKAREMGGAVSGEHGIGWAKKGYLKTSLGDAQIRIMNEIKHVFDPENILNPSKICQ